jgi:hypothetical protein
VNAASNDGYRRVPARSSGLGVGGSIRRRRPAAGAFYAAGGMSTRRRVPVADPKQGPGLTAAAAMAAAVRQELTSPGSVLQQQLSLFLADRTAHQLADTCEHA